MAESKLQKQILNLLEAKGCYAIKIIASNKVGVNDIIASYPVETSIGKLGIFISIEVKDENKEAEPSLAQQVNQHNIIDTGGFAITVNNLISVMKFLSEITEELNGD